MMKLCPDVFPKYMGQPGPQLSPLSDVNGPSSNRNSAVCAESVTPSTERGELQGATFISPVGAVLRTVSTIEHYPPPHMDDPMVDLYVSRPNSLTMGAAPYTPPLSPGDNNDVVDENDDSLTIEIDPPRAAVGFYLIDQDPGDPPPEGESIVYKDVDGIVIETIEPLPTAIYPDHQFVGITSYGRPIAVVEINEAPMGFSDDICIDHVVLPQ